MMADLIKTVQLMTELEKRNALAKHGILHSRNEGYGVIAEEIDEVMEQINIINRYFDSLVRVIRYDLRELDADLKKIKNSAMLAACECIQVAAVAQRFIDMVEKEDNHGES